MRGGETMRVIYMRLLISGALVAAMLALGAFGPQRDALTATPPVSAAGTGH
jgi:hypothetical protein